MEESQDEQQLSPLQIRACNSFKSMWLKKCEDAICSELSREQISLRSEMTDYNLACSGHITDLIAKH